jgi:molecular chaperone GrpE
MTLLKKVGKIDFKLYSQRHWVGNCCTIYSPKTDLRDQLLGKKATFESGNSSYLASSKIAIENGIKLYKGERMTEKETVSKEPLDTTSGGQDENSETGVLETEAIVDEVSTAREAKEAGISAELEKAKKEIADLKDSWLRERAEFQNYKRRTAAEFISIQRDSVKNFVSKLLTPLDNLDRVTSVEAKEETKPLLDGIEMIKKEIYTVLEKESIYKVNPLNQPFDPMTMEALSAVESEEYKEEVVIEVYQSGFEIRDENQSYSLRPSRVRIGKPTN